jgi:hypothetical protein
MVVRVEDHPGSASRSSPAHTGPCGNVYCAIDEARISLE